MVWNGWTVDGKLGEGGFGKVYRIVKNDFGHVYQAALKVIEIPGNQEELKAIYSEGMSEQEISNYFDNVARDVVNEFELMYQLKGHPNIVGYEDHQVVRNSNGVGWVIYIRMELLTGIYDYMRNRAGNGLRLEEVLRLGIDMCKALESCRRHHIIHRDLKPENIFVTKTGTFKLGDFGIARKLEQTMGGLSKKGTYNYMAPEVYNGQEYNATVDIYSLGIVMYRMLNNNRGPFLPAPPEPIKYQDRDKALRRRMKGEPLPPPCYANQELSGIILKACFYNPRERYQSAEEMRGALENYLVRIKNRSLNQVGNGQNVEVVSQAGSVPQSGSGSNARSAQQPGNILYAGAVPQSGSGSHAGLAQQSGNILYAGAVPQLGSGSHAGLAQQSGNRPYAGSVPQSGSGSNARSAQQPGNRPNAGAIPQSGNGSDAGTAQRSGNRSNAGAIPQSGSGSDAGSAPQSGSSLDTGLASQSVNGSNIRVLSKAGDDSQAKSASRQKAKYNFKLITVVTMMILGIFGAIIFGVSKMTSYVTSDLEDKESASTNVTDDTDEEVYDFEWGETFTEE